MAQTYTCDWCGDEIVSDGVRGVAHLNTHGLHTDIMFVSMFTRHFHAGAHNDDDSCFLRALSAFEDHLATNSPQPRVVDHVKQRQEARDVWGQLSSERREALLLNALADNRLTIRELASGMATELGYAPDDRAGALGEYYTRPLVRRLFRDGQLERVAEEFKGKTRYRYLRKRALEGPIVELERAYHDESTGEDG
jgi:hypothetical protein